MPVKQSSTNTLHIPELLSPAGNYECALAAIQNGADAVYLGLQKGSARKFAGNFNFDELKDIIQYAHELDVSVFVALNTLLYDSETDAALADAVKSSELGADALILQDLGLASEIVRLKEKGLISPYTALHASTQMSMGTTYAAEFLKKAGFDRLILPRELSINEIRKIAGENILPVECFVHGALCMSFSGQCLMSSYIGERSGNRGDCAQPCRMEYTYKGGKTEEKGYLLSPRDICGLPLLDRIVSTGVSSLKIEGRMKSSTYVALVTNVYRKALDRIKAGTFEEYKKSEMEEDIRNTKAVFSRGEYISGYLLNHLRKTDLTGDGPGRKGLHLGKLLSGPVLLPKKPGMPDGLNIVSVRLACNYIPSAGDGITVRYPDGAVFGGTVNTVSKKDSGTAEIRICSSDFRKYLREMTEGEVFLTSDTLLSEKVSNTFSKGCLNRRIGLQCSFRGMPGEYAVLRISDNRGNTVISQSEMVLEKAGSSPADYASVEKQLKKSGNTPYDINLTEVVTENAFIPVSVLNSLRRDALGKLSEIRKNSHTFPCPHIPVTEQYTLNGIKPGNIKGNTLYFFDEKDFLNSDVSKMKLFNPKMIYIPHTAWENEAAAEACRNTAAKLGAKLIASFPFISLGRELERISKNLESILTGKNESDGVLLTNPGDFILLKKYRNVIENRKVIALDYSFNVTNSCSVKFLDRFGPSVITVSPETVRDSGIDANSVFGTETLIEQVSDGRTVLMRTRHCVISPSGQGCGFCKGLSDASITDNRGAVYKIKPIPGDCQNIILSPGPFRGCSITENHVSLTRIVFDRPVI